MNKLIYLFSILIFTGCASGHVIFELSAQKPISTECAYNAISEMKDYDFVTKKENEIEFYNKAYGGNLYHGGEIQFINYGLELKTSPPLGPNLKKVADKLVDTIYSRCLSNA